jgi:hypothetical protein
MGAGASAGERRLAHEPGPWPGHSEVIVTLTLNDLRLPVDPAERGTLLSSWRWLTGPDAVPVLLTVLGDAFVQAPKESAIRLLAVGAATLTPVASGMDEFKLLLADEGFVRKHFAPDVVRALRVAGTMLAPGQVYSYRIPPALGGSRTVDNRKPLSVAEHFSVLGQICEHAAHMGSTAPLPQ